uniref:Uncharacterized protein n=1 Tax=Meloidogyne javanica TaxID=6303 RepID=A0A915LIM9_MELJA
MYKNAEDLIQNKTISNGKVSEGKYKKDEYGNIKRSTNIQGGNDEEIEEIEPLTPSTGEGCLDSVRSIIATNGETPTKILENSEDDWSEQNTNLIDDNECRRVSSTISRELVNSVIELAIQPIITKLKFSGYPSYTAFEPEKQEIIRKEIGSFGPEGIKKIVDKFQNVAKLNRKEEEEIIAEIKNKKLKNKVFARQKSAHFYIEKEQVPKQQEDQPKRKSTPHPVQRQSSLQQQQPEEENKILNNTKNNFSLSRSEIVIESQRPVADILNQFQSYSQQIPPITCFTKEPTPGSLAAIRLSLSSSIPSTPSENVNNLATNEE